MLKAEKSLEKSAYLLRLLRSLEFDSASIYFKLSYNLLPSTSHIIHHIWDVSQFLTF